MVLSRTIYAEETHPSASNETGERFTCRRSLQLVVEYNYARELRPALDLRICPFTKSVNIEVSA